MKAEKSHVMDLLFTLALFCVFAASSLLVVLLGAEVYRNTVSEMTRNYNTRTSITYLAEKIRQNDTAGSVSIRQVAENDALVLAQRLGKGEYETWIYTGNGQLREVMVAAGTPVKVTDGQEIMPIGSLKLEQQGQLLRLTATDPDGAVSSLTLATRCP